MSIVEPQTAKPDGDAGLLSKIPDQIAKIPADLNERWEKFARSPQARLPLGRGKKLTVHVDRVRAKPAISPQLSFQIGVTAIGLGLWGSLFPNHVKKTLGIRAPAPVVQAIFGARELVTGYSLAGDPTKSGMLWARVAGDVFDIVALKALDNRRNPQRGTVRAALGFVLLVTALDAVTAARMSNVKRTCE
jgi:hypothetical protein